MSEKLPTFVFVHGFMGTNEIKLPGLTIEYFRGVKALMGRLGVPCVIPALPRVASVERRGRALAQFLARALDETAAARYVLVGSSQGGLDSRYVAANLDPRRRVVAVVTIGTPHRGSSLATWALTSNNPLAVLTRLMGREGLVDLSPGSCARFNRATPDRADVLYLSWAGQRPVNELPLWLRPFGGMLSRAEGANDGQVAVASARWGEFQGIVRADHYEQFGWNFGRARAAIQRPFDHLALYREMVGRVLERLAAQAPPA